MYSYADRLKAMRETKIRHTLEKRTQNGYNDLDDFGTVPIPQDYEVEPWYNSTNGSFYGYEGMSENFVRIMDAHPAYVDLNEMLCGRWRDMLVNYRGDPNIALIIFGTYKSVKYLYIKANTIEDIIEGIKSITWKNPPNGRFLYM